MVGDDLPAQSEFVAQPAARYLLAASRKARPIVVDLLLRLAVDDKETASLKRCAGPPLRAVNRIPSSSKATVSTPPFGPGASPVLRSSPVRREFGKMEM